KTTTTSGVTPLIRLRTLWGRPVSKNRRLSDGRRHCSDLLGRIPTSLATAPWRSAPSAPNIVAFLISSLSTTSPPLRRIQPRLATSLTNATPSDLWRSPPIAPTTRHLSGMNVSFSKRPRHNDFRDTRLTSGVTRGLASLKPEPHNALRVIPIEEVSHGA